MPRNKNAVSEIIQNNIVAQYQSGSKSKFLSEKYSLSRATINNILNKYKVEYRKSDIGGGVKEQTKKIIYLYKQGYSRIEIRNMLSIPKGRLDAICCLYRLVGQRKYYRLKRHLNDNYFDIIDTPNKSYFLGLLFADGNVSKNSNSINISLKEDDKYLIEDFKREIQSDSKVYVRHFTKNPTWKDTYTLNVSSEKIKQDLIKYGCTPQKSLTVQFPDIRKEIFWHFLRGYFDGDGCISINGNNSLNKRITIVGSEVFNKKLKKILWDDYGINCYFSQRVNYSTLVISKREDIAKVREYFYTDANFYMKRKKEKFFK